MGGNESKHLALLRILHILEKYSDSNHPLMQNVINKYLQRDYGICLERKAISNNISLLKEAGYDIVEVPHKGVYLAERLFSDEELKLLISDVYLSKYINEGQTKQIVDKLKDLGGINFRKSMASIYGTKKICIKKTKEIFETADIISRAIEKNRKIKFTQNEYGVDKNLHAISKNIIVSPYQVISANDKYYLLCNIDGYDNITSFSLDKITELVELANPRKDIRETRERGIRLERYISENPYMLDSNSEITRIYARVKIDKIGSVIDSFGDDFNVSEESLDTVDIDFRANINDVLHWALYNSDCVEIKKPQSLRNELERLADKMSEVYGKNDTDRYRDIIADAKSNGELNIFRTVELKRVLNDGFEKSLVAFLNTKAGTIYIGVEDDGSVTGVENTDETLKRIADIITTQILPNPQEYIELGTKFVDGKQVIEVKVNKGNALYYIKKYGRSANGCYMRIGTSNRSMTEEQIEKQFISYLNIPEKTMVEKASSRSDLPFSQFKTILAFKDVHYNETAFEQNYNLRNSSGQYNYLAFLLSDQNDTSIKVVRFRGKDKTEFISRKEFPAGCIFKQMDDALDYALNILNIVQTNITASERVDTPYFDEAAFREAWYNAVCHNLWVEQTPPAIYGFADRVEIISYGLLKKGMTEEEFFAGVSRPVNDEFAKIFMQLHYMEQSGKGVPTVVKKYGKEAYHFGSSFIQCILPYNILDQAKADAMNGNTEQEVPSKVPGKITVAQQKMLDIIIQSPGVTQQEISDQLGISFRMVTKHIKALKDKCIICRIDSDKTG